MAVETVLHILAEMDLDKSIIFHIMTGHAQEPAFRDQPLFY